MTNNVELMSLYWTTAGVLPWYAEISRFDFKDRVEAAARAGFKGIGIWHTDLEHDMLHRSLKEMKMILDDNGMQYLELEFLTDWFVDGVFIGVGPWFHGPEGFHGHVNNHFHPDHGYKGPVPHAGERPTRPVDKVEHFKGNEVRDGRGHLGGGEKR